MIEKIYYNKKTDIEKSLEIIFKNNNIAHQSILISKLNERMYEPKLLNSVRNYIKKKSVKIKSFKNSLDTCGTGGDGKKTLNISTSVSLLLASNDIKISKHGNRAASSDSGSTDILKELGVKMETEENKIHKSLKDNNFVYLNAPFFYPILKEVAEVRKLMGFRTFFNMLGPTLNPLKTNYQIVGAFNENAAKSIANILLINKLKNFKVYSSKDGLDEISIFSPTVIWEKSGDKIIKKLVLPKNFKKYLTNKSPSFDEIIGKNAKFNAKRLINLFEGKKDSYRDIVVINSIYGMMTKNSKLNFEDCYEKITSSINSKRQIDLLNKLTK